MEASMRVVWFVAMALATLPLELAFALPPLALPDLFKVNLFAEFTDANTPGGGADDAFQMTISDGSNGFPAGMMITGGLGSDNRVFVLDAGAVSSARSAAASTAQRPGCLREACCRHILA
jgi:hypothetical protein